MKKEENYRRNVSFSRYSINGRLLKEEQRQKVIGREPLVGSVRVFTMHILFFVYILLVFAAIAYYSINFICFAI